MSKVLSRRDFLKMMGSFGIIGIGAALTVPQWKKFAGLETNNNNNNNNNNPTTSQQKDGYQIIDAPMDMMIDQHWNNIASKNPDGTENNIVFLRTSPDQIPLERSLMVLEKQLVFIPWRTAQYDKDDNNIPKEKWIDTAWQDMRAGDQDATVTIDGHKEIPTFSEPHFTSTTVSPDLKVNLLIPFKKPSLDEVRESVTTGYGLLVKLAKGNHKIESSFQGSNNYKSSGIWNIQVV